MKTTAVDRVVRDLTQSQCVHHSSHHSAAAAAASSRAATTLDVCDSQTADSTARALTTSHTDTQVRTRAETAARPSASRLGARRAQTWFGTVTRRGLTVRDDETLGRTPLVGHDGGQTGGLADRQLVPSLCRSVIDHHHHRQSPLCRSDGPEWIRTDPETQRAPSASRDRCCNL